MNWQRTAPRANPSNASLQPTVPIKPAANGLNTRKISAIRQLFNFFSRDPWLIFLTALFSVITFLFYTTNFRSELENFFYDTRTKWMPPAAISKSVVVVEIDDQSIATLETDSLRTRFDHQRRPYLSTRNLTIATSILANSEATAIGLLMPEHAFPAADPDMTELRDIVKYDPRIVIGTTGYNQRIPNLGSLPPIFRDIENQVAGFETFRQRSNSIVRELSYFSFRGLTEIETLPTKVAEIVDPEFGAENGTYKLKHAPPQHYPSIKIEQLIQSPGQLMDSFKGKSVVVGYTSARDAGFQTTEQMLVNTPLTGSGPTNVNGISSTWLVANAIENLTAGENLRPVPELATLVQTAVVALACGLSWEFGSSVAAITTLAIWLLLISFHSALYRWGSVSMPLADTFLATVLISLFAATRRVNIEINNMAEQQVNASAKSEIAQIQSQFLSGFSQWLSNLTDAIMEFIQNSEKSSHHDAKTTDLYLRANHASADFKEYLMALSQLSQLESISPNNLVQENIDLETLVATIIRRFETKSHERHILFETLVATEARELTSVPNFIDAILFNFVSNAVKYSPDHTTIQIRIERGSSGETIFSVLDQGPGISPEFHQRIFERFYRINDDQLYSAKGTGLGLYLCRYFAECLGGRVEVLSEPGSGSEFRAVIP